MKIVGVIPARYQAQRFPGKPLAVLAGKPMVQWVYDAARRALPRVIVATDDPRIVRAIESVGGESCLTSPRCQSGTDRVAEVARRVRADLYVNIQGDEPLMSARTIAKVAALHKNRNVRMGTAATALKPGDRDNPNTVKVLLNKRREALYFSRAPLPFDRDGNFPFSQEKSPVYKHLGLYSYRADFLKTFVRWPLGYYERAEKLEQLRALENGGMIHVAITPDDSTGVDTPDDAARVEALLRQR